MRKMVKPIHDKFMADYDPALVKTFVAELDRIHK